MENLFYILLIVLFLVVSANLQKGADRKKFKGDILLGKQCPPHRWSWKEQPGLQGHYYISCDSCKKMPSWKED